MMALTVPQNTPQKRYRNNEATQVMGFPSGIRRRAFGKVPGIRDKPNRGREACYSHSIREES